MFSNISFHINDHILSRKIKNEGRKKREMNKLLDVREIERNSQITANLENTHEKT